jgi:TonB family protein
VPGVLVMAVCFGLVGPLEGQDLLQQVKDLYASAAYEAALTAVASKHDSDPDLEIEQYRVLCLVALGRSADAERAVEQLLKQDPVYRPVAADTPPRIQELFTTVRRRLGPSLVQAMYLDGKSAFDRKDRDAAVRIFEKLASVTDDRDLRDNPVVSEIRLLAGGFLTLSKALPEKSIGDRVEPIAPPAPAPSSEPAVPKPVASLPVPIHEDLPVWRPSDEFSRRIEFRGSVRVSISAKGTVDSVDLVQPIHPAYDALLLRAAKDWTYQPGRVNGVAVPSERTVTVVLKPKS